MTVQTSYQNSVIFKFDIVQIALSIVGILLHSFDILAFLLTKKLRKAKFFQLMVTVSVADIIFCAGFIIPSANRLQQLVQNTPSTLTELQCVELNTPVFFGIYLESLLLVVIAVERLYSVVAPFHYAIHNDRVANWLLGLACVLSAFFTGVMFVNVSSIAKVSLCVPSATLDFGATILSFCCQLVPACVYSVLTVVLVVRLWREGLKVGAQLPIMMNQRKAKKKFAKHLVIMFAGNWATLGVSVLIKAALLPISQSGTGDSLTTSLLVQLSSIFGLLYPIVHFAVYIGVNSDMRDGMKSLIKKIRRWCQKQPVAVQVVGAANDLQR